MKTRSEDVLTINRKIFPAILGRPLFIEKMVDATDMGYAETAMFEALLSHVKPSYAIEVGTETGATLAIMARHSEHVISIDIDPAVKQRLSSKFTNVDFLTGSSHDVLPLLLKKLTTDRVTPDFIFVDGDHTADGVRRDL
jgi:cephalosporin hydroxylase